MNREHGLVYARVAEHSAGEWLYALTEVAFPAW